MCRLERRCVVVLSVPPPDSLGLLDYTKPCQAAVTAAAALCLDLIKPPAERVCFSLPRACSAALCVHNTFCTNTKCLFLLLIYPPPPPPPPDPTLPSHKLPNSGEVCLVRARSRDASPAKQARGKLDPIRLSLSLSEMLFLFPVLLTT